jgi:hypothetical protein
MINNEKVLIFPTIKKPEIESKEFVHKEMTDDQYEEIAEHFTTQLSKYLINHGFEMEEFLFRDLYLVFESIKSAMMRANNKYNPTQDYADLLHSMSNEEEKEDEKQNDPD